jgi:hypothetical protein
MIHIIGVKKAIMLGVLTAVNAGLGAALYFYLIPESTRLVGEAQTAQQQAAAKQADTVKLRQEYDTIQDQKTLFQNLDAVGFFSDQNRFVARRRIEQIQEFTNVMTARYDIGSAKIEENDLVKESQHVLLNSPVRIEIDAIDDVDFFNFIYWAENGFPGHVSIRNVSLKRNQTINEAVLREIAGGAPVALISGSITFDWHTILSESEVNNETDAGRQGM